ncbi:Naringenin,2-oxoglutarate 3-dioxygenase [Morella rubra]|uniref:Naringenin,2-oxoglutarate 3-dioxygenase n=1 Tax=Morella rubra TaxID=262757 RepID=A0A6A1W4M9_9ROSI|nr:Naringenin,2-oxoglutarate 3-dioxygenase [Morella rubra]
MAPTTLKALAKKKTLQASFVRDEDERPKVAYNNFSNEIPVISLAGIDEVDGRRAEICKKIVEACEDWGIFQVVDHGVDAELISDMTRLAREFFALPPEEKLRFDMSDGKKGGFRVSSHLQGEAVQNWREFVTYSSYPIRKGDYSRWPNKPEGWRAVTQQYSETLMGLARKLLEVLSEAMGLEKEALAKACVEINQKVMVNYYPKCPQPDSHLDSSATPTPVPSPSCSRIRWVGSRPPGMGGRPGSSFNLLKELSWPISEITVIGKSRSFPLLWNQKIEEYMSKGRFKAAEHQAVVNSNCSRLSIATFMIPAPEAIIYPLKIREGEKPELEEPILFADIYRKKLSRDLEVINSLKKTAKEQKLQD